MSMSMGMTLEQNLARDVMIPVGWRPIYCDAVRAIYAIDATMQVEQTKEEYGELRDLSVSARRANGRDRRCCKS